MKIQGNKFLWISLVFVWCIFMGVTFVSMGLGAEFPSLNLIAQPFVCPGGRMELITQDYQVSPVESGTILHWYCTDARTGTKTELNPFLINLYAGPFQGLALAALIFGIWYLYTKWDPDKASPLARKVVGWIPGLAVIGIVVGMTVFNLLPIFRSLGATPVAIATPNATATSIARTYEALLSGQTASIDSTDKPPANWKGVPIMPQATAGEQSGNDRYRFRVPTDTGTITDFYKAKLVPLGWVVQNDQMLGLRLSKGQSTLLVTLAPDTDLESFVVTLVLVP